MMTKKIFYSLLVNFLLILTTMFIPTLRKLGPLPLVMLFTITFALLGIILIWRTLEEKPEDKLKKFLLLTGGSAIGFLLSVILHNLFYAVAEIGKTTVLIYYPAEVLHVLFFFMAVPIFPIGFIIGTIGAFLRYQKPST